MEAELAVFRFKDEGGNRMYVGAGLYPRMRAEDLAYRRWWWGRAGRDGVTPEDLFEPFVCDNRLWPTSAATGVGAGILAMAVLTPAVEVPDVGPAGSGGGESLVAVSVGLYTYHSGSGKLADLVVGLGKDRATGRWVNMDHKMVRWALGDPQGRTFRRRIGLVVSASVFGLRAVLSRCNVLLMSACRCCRGARGTWCGTRMCSRRCWPPYGRL
jgi:hypothetical protein